MCMNLKQEGKCTKKFSIICWNLRLDRNECLQKYLHEYRPIGIGSTLRFLNPTKYGICKMGFERDAGLLKEHTSDRVEIARISSV